MKFYWTDGNSHVCRAQRVCELCGHSKQTKYKHKTRNTSNSHKYLCFLFHFSQTKPWRPKMKFHVTKVSETITTFAPIVCARACIVANVQCACTWRCESEMLSFGSSSSSSPSSSNRWCVGFVGSSQEQHERYQSFCSISALTVSVEQSKRSHANLNQLPHQNNMK